MDNQTATDEKTEIDKGRLTDEQGQRLVDLLNEKIADLQCELCGSTDFVTNPHLGSPLFVTLDEKGKTEVDWGVSHPCAITHCKNCGNTKFHSLRMLNFDPHAGEEK